MIINRDIDCIKCDNQDICKLTEEFKKAKEKVVEIKESISSTSPIRVNLDCNRYKENLMNPFLISL